MYKYSLLVKKQVPFILIRRGNFQRIVVQQTNGRRHFELSDSEMLGTKYKFRGVYAAGWKFSNRCYRQQLFSSQFFNVCINWGPMASSLSKRSTIYFCRSLRPNALAYKHLQRRIASNFNVNTVFELLRNHPILKQNSILCGLIFNYIVYIILSWQKLVKMCDTDLLCFALHTNF